MRLALVRLAVGCAFGLVAASVPSHVAAQTGKLTGVVRDQATNQPLDGVEIFIEGSGVNTFTAPNGRFFLLNVAPGVVTVVARRLGYQPVRQTGVNIGIDVTREVNFALTASQATTLDAVTVEAEAVPLVQPGVSSTTASISGDLIRALPVVSIEGALKLQQGFLQVPDNTDIISYSESRRNVTNPIRIRGGRGGETVTLIDGIPVNNWIYGGPAISLTPEAVNQLDYLKGGFEPQYGNALSGIVNIATRDGGTNLAGSLRYQTSAFGGALGNRQDELSDNTLVDGYLSGPIPGTTNHMRFMVAGRQSRGADAVYEFDDIVRDPSVNGAPFSYGFQQPNFMDLYPGWRAFGFNNQRDVFGKLTYVFKPTMKLGLSFVDYRAQRQPFDFTYLLTYDDPLEAPIIDTEADSVALIGNRTGDRLRPLDFFRVPQGSINSTRNLLVARLDHTLGRTYYGLALGRFSLERQTCNYWQGICLGTNFADPNFTDDQFISPKTGECDIHPTCGVDNVSGGEKLRSWVARADVQSQVTDHHNLQVGFMSLFHKLSLDETENIGGNEVIRYPKHYDATPWDAALYFQDRIEYDFLTIKLGVRYDLGSAGGRFWVNPLDPTNGTQADEVCANPTAWGTRTITVYDPSTGAAYDTTIAANASWATQLGPNCVNLGTGLIDPAVKDSAALIASSDDFGQSKRRRQFSPRIGVNFPLGPSSAVFFNFGRYTQNPLLNNLYISTGIGSAAEGTTSGPQLFTPSGSAVSFMGNPNLLTEQTTAYEVGYAAELGGNYGVSFALFSKDQLGLTGFRTGGVTETGAQVSDIGTTYGSAAPSYRILVNADFQTVRGFEVRLQRRVASHWGFDINYAFSESRTNASDPEREVERQVEQGDPRLNQEVISDVDQPHVFNASLIFQGGQDLGGVLGRIVKDLSSSVVFRAQSGLPYTPTLDFLGAGLSQLVRNSGRGPTTFQLDWSLSKNFAVSNLRYGFTLQVLNVTDRKNCVQVYTTTGNCTTGTVDQGRRREGNGIDDGAVSTTYLDRAQYYSARRTVQAGLRVTF